MLLDTYQLFSYAITELKVVCLTFFSRKVLSILLIIFTDVNDQLATEFSDANTTIAFQLKVSLTKIILQPL